MSYAGAVNRKDLYDLTLLLYEEVGNSYPALKVILLAY